MKKNKLSSQFNHRPGSSFFAILIMILLALPAIFVSIVLFLEIARLIRKKYFYDSYCEFEGKNEKRWKAMKWWALIIGVIYGSWVIYFIRAVSNWSRGG